MIVESLPFFNQKIYDLYLLDKPRKDKKYRLKIVM